MTPLRARLLVLSGPVAAGKSTVARELTARLVAAGCTVACTDLDDVARLAHAPGGLTAEHWAQAHRTHGALVAALLERPFDLVVAHGPIYTAEEAAALLERVPPGTAVLRVLLTCDLGAALERVGADPDRGLSRDPEFLRAAHARFWSHRSELPSDLVVDTGAVPVDELCAGIEALLRPAAPLVPRLSRGATA